MPEDKKYGQLVWTSMIHNTLEFEIANTLPKLVYLGLAEANDFKEALQEISRKLAVLHLELYEKADLDSKEALAQGGFRLRHYPPWQHPEEQKKEKGEISE